MGQILSRVLKNGYKAISETFAGVITTKILDKNGNEILTRCKQVTRQITFPDSIMTEARKSAVKKAKEDLSAVVDRVLSQSAEPKKHPIGFTSSLYRPMGIENTKHVSVTETQPLFEVKQVSNEVLNQSPAVRNQVVTIKKALVKTDGENCYTITDRVYNDGKRIGERKFISNQPKFKRKDANYLKEIYTNENGDMVLQKSVSFKNGHRVCEYSGNAGHVYELENKVMGIKSTMEGKLKELEELKSTLQAANESHAYGNKRRKYIMSQIRKFKQLLKDYDKLSDKALDRQTNCLNLNIIG